MKKRTIITLTAAAMLFTVVVFQLHREADAETQTTNITVTIKATDGLMHGNYKASLIDDRTGQVVLDLPGQKIGTYPSIHGGQGSFPNGGFFRIYVCSDQNWGEITSPFKITDGVDINMMIYTHFKCPRIPNVQE